MPMFETPIVDAHVHLWDPAVLPIHWIAGNTTLDQPLGLAEYRAQTAGIDVTALIYVQVDAAPAYGLVEAQWAAARAQEEPRLQAIVAWAPLEDGLRARSYLDALVSISPRIKGVRRLLQGESDPAFCLRPDFIRGVQLLAEYGLSFDLCITHHQLAHTIELVRQCPDVAFMLDHLGKPAIANHQLAPWQEQLRELAALPNVMCKISGTVTEADHARWTSDDIAPFIAHALAVFGEDRVVFGSDWPVVLLATSYQQWVTTLDMLTMHLSSEARQKLWSENARRFYHLTNALV